MVGWIRRVAAPIRPWRQWTLRTRLVVLIAALAAVAMVVASLTAVYFLRDNLMSGVDSQLRSQGRAFTRGDVFDLPSRPRPGFGQDFRVYVYNPSGQQLFTDEFAVDMPAGPILGGWDSIQAHAGVGPYTVDGVDGASWRVIVTEVPQGVHLGPFDSGPDIGGYIGVAALSLRDVTNTSENLLLIDALVIALILLLLAAAAASVVRFGLRPLTRMEATAAEISGTDDLSRRVEDTDPHTESGRLGTALNAMLGRVQGAMAARTASEQRLRQFLADASHELRTPLTSIQGFAELYRRGGTPPGPELDEAMGRIEGEVGRMRVLVNDLLLLARLDEERPMNNNLVDLLGVAAETVRDAHVRVPHRFVQLTALNDYFDTFEPVTVLGDDDRLRQVATNLIGNALQHSGDDARVVVRVGRAQVVTDPPPTVGIGAEFATGSAVAVLEVADTGPGMTPDDAGRVFERLFRAERSRDRRHGGAGLGLAIVAAIVSAHGGRVNLYTEPGSGSRFRVMLPALTAPDDLDTDDSEPAPSFPEVPVEPPD